MATPEAWKDVIWLASKKSRGPRDEKGLRAVRRVEVVPVPGIPDVAEGDDIASVILRALGRLRFRLRDGDVVVVKQKIISKAEGRMVRLDDVVPGRRAAKMARRLRKDPRLVELVLRESVRVVRAARGVMITETRQGLVCANSGVDKSNIKDGYVALLPVDPDRSARRIRERLSEESGTTLAVVVSDTFGRPWRRGQTDVAIGCSGIIPLRSYRGMTDRYGYQLRVTEPAVADEIAAAAELVTGKLLRVPVAVVRGATYRPGERRARSMRIEKEKDLFR